MKKVQIIISVASLVLFALGGCAHHHDGHHGAQEGHEGCDCDHGHDAHGAEGHHAGNVTEHVDEVFAKLDTNADKALARAEVEGHPLEGRFDQADADGNDSISYDEMLVFGRRMHGGEAEEGH